MFEIYSIRDLLYSDACIVFVVTGIICAAVRWFHMCHPFDKIEKTSYPARRQMTFFYAATCLQFPYILEPSNPDVWIYIRSFCILYYPMFLTCVLDRYFHRKTLRDTIGTTIYVVIPFCWLLFLLILSICDRPLLARWESPLLILSIVGSLVLTYRLTRVILKIKRQIDAFHEQNFSSEGDFPLRFAERILGLPFAWLLCMWAIFVTGSQELKMFFDLSLSVVMVLFLCIILHPQRIEKTMAADKLPTTFPIDEKKIKTPDDVFISAEDESLKVKDTEPLQDENYDGIRQEVLTIIRRRYLEPNLKRSDVIAEVTYGKHTLAGLYITQIGFYRLVNTFRLTHAQLYEAKHPNLSKDAIAEASGFKDRFALHNAKKKIGTPEVKPFEGFLPQDV